MRTWALAVVLLAPWASAQDGRWRVTLGATFGQETLGSEDTRRGGWYGVGYERPEKRLAWRGLTPTLEWHAYYMFTKGGGFEDIPVNKMRSTGLMAIARYPITRWQRGDLYVSAGWGLVYNSIRTRDLDSNVNSTPSLGLGWESDGPFIEARWFHMSNAGFAGNNQGLNQVQFLAGWRF